MRQACGWNTLDDDNDVLFVRGHFDARDHAQAR